MTDEELQKIRVWYEVERTINAPRTADEFMAALRRVNLLLTEVDLLRTEAKVEVQARRFSVREMIDHLNELAKTEPPVFEP